MSPVCGVLVFMFPHIHKWKNSIFSLNLELSLSCLNLLHSVLNASFNSIQASSSVSKYQNSFDNHYSNSK